MKTHHREILIYYNPESSNDRKTVAHAQGLVPHVLTYSFDKAPSTGKSWQQIIQALGLHPKRLMNKAHPYYQEHLAGKEFDDADWINIIMKNPALIVAPIAIRGDKAVLCVNATDIYQLNIEDEVSII